MTRYALSWIVIVVLAATGVFAAGIPTDLGSGAIGRGTGNLHNFSNISAYQYCFNATGTLRCIRDWSDVNSSTGGGGGSGVAFTLSSGDVYTNLTGNTTNKTLTANLTAYDARYALLTNLASLITNTSLTASGLASLTANFTGNQSLFNASILALQVRVNTLNTTAIADNTSISNLQVRVNTLNTTALADNTSITNLQVRANTFNTTDAALSANDSSFNTSITALQVMNASNFNRYNTPFSCGSTGYEYSLDGYFWNATGLFANCTEKGRGIYAGTNISIVMNANGSINISATGGGGGSSFDPSGLYNNVTGLQAANASMNASILNLQVAVFTLNGSVTSLGTGLASLISNFTANQSADNASITNLQIRVNTINSTYALQTGLSSLVTNFTGNQTSFNTSISNLQVRADTLNTSALADNTSITNLQIRTNTLNTTAQAANTSITNLQAQTTDLNLSVIALRAANTTTNISVTNLQIAFKSLNDSLESGLINSSMLNSTDSPSIAEVLSYAGNGQFEWVAQSAGGGGASGVTATNCGLSYLPFATNSSNFNCTGIRYLYDSFRVENYIDAGGMLITNSTSFRQPSKSGLVAEWHFDNTLNGVGESVTSLLGSGPRQFDLVKAGAPTYQATGSHDDSGAYTFLASGDQLNSPYIPSQNTYAITREITYGCWIYANWTDQYNGFPGVCVGKNGVTNNRIISYFNNATGAIVMNAGNTTNTDDLTDSGSYVFQNNTWYHLVFSYDACGSNQAKLYINGEIIAARSQPASLGNCTALVNDTGPFEIAENFKGKIDDVFIYDRVLTDDEVRNLYESDYKNTPQLDRAGDQTLYGNFTINGSLSLQNNLYDSRGIRQWMFDAFNMTLAQVATSNNTVYSNINNLTLYLQPLGQYEIDCNLILAGAAATTGTHLRVNTTGSPTTVTMTYTSSSSATAMESFSGTNTASNAFTSDAGNIANANSGVASLVGYVVTSSSVSVFTVEQKSEVAASNSFVRAGSFCRAMRLN